MWLGLDRFNLCRSKARRLIGCPCQGIGEQTGNPIPISMANLWALGSRQRMEWPKCFKTLCHQIGPLAKPSLARFSSKLKYLRLRVQGFEFQWQRRACYFGEAARHFFFAFILFDGWDGLNPWTQEARWIFFRLWRLFQYCNGHCCILIRSAVQLHNIIFSRVSLICM